MADTEQQLFDEVQELRKQGKFKEGPGYVHCVICAKKAYPAETVMFERVPFHTQCFKCTKCSKKIEGGFNAAMYELDLYCRGCFASSGFNRLQAQVKWTPKSSGSQSSYNPAFANLGGGATTCKVCEKAVYAAEGQLFEKEIYHPDCLRCQEDGCGVLCTVSQLNKFGGKIYCGSCWNKGDYRKKQLTQSSGTPKQSGSYNPAFANLGGGGSKCVKCTKTVYDGEKLMFEKEAYHPECFACCDCNVKMVLSQANKFEDNIYCTKCWTNGDYRRKQLDAAKQWKPSSSGQYNAAFANLGSGSSATKCQKCEKTVYDGEKLLYETKYYHPGCFKCTHCEGKIDNINNAQHKNKQPFCKRCFTQLELHRPDKSYP